MNKIVSSNFDLSIGQKGLKYLHLDNPVLLTSLTFIILAVFIWNLQSSEKIDWPNMSDEFSEDWRKTFIREINESPTHPIKNETEAVRFMTWAYKHWFSGDNDGIKAGLTALKKIDVIQLYRHLKDFSAINRKVLTTYYMEIIASFYVNNTHEYTDIYDACFNTGSTTEGSCSLFADEKPWS